MASRFWVGGGSANTWAATGTTNWAATSGGANDASVPGTTDMAVFDSNSGSGNSVIGANITVQGLECDGSTLGTGAYAGTLTHNINIMLTINTGAANSLRFSSGMTYTVTGGASSGITLTHTSGTANIKSNGKSIGHLIINGAGGTTQTLDALFVNVFSGATITLTSGTLDFNGGAGGPYAVTATSIQSNSSVARTLILGGLVTLGGNLITNSSVLIVAGAGVFTFTKNSANIEILKPTSPAVGWSLTPGSIAAFNDLTLDATTTPTIFSLSGTCTYSHLNVGAGWIVNLAPNVTTTVSNPFTWSGTQANPILLAANSINPVATTLSCPSGACTLNWGGVQNVTATGGATFTATNALNLGANAGWSISPPADSTITPPPGFIAAMARGTVTTGAGTGSIPTSAFTFSNVAASGVVLNQFVGRVVLFDGNTLTTGLQGAAAVISASTSSNTPTLSTLTALPATPASGDTFTVI